MCFDDGTDKKDKNITMGTVILQKPYIGKNEARQNSCSCKLIMFLNGNLNKPKKYSTVPG